MLPASVQLYMYIQTDSFALRLLFTRPQVAALLTLSTQMCKWVLCPPGTGKTVAENLATYPSLSDLTQTVIYPVAEPFSAAGNHITVISGSLAPESALIKLSGKTMKTFEGPAQVYDGEQKAFEAIIR